VKRLTPQLRTILEESVIPSPNRIVLGPGPLDRFVSRLASADPHPAELFQESSKLSRYSSANLPASESAASAAADWVLETAYRPRPEDIDGRATVEHGVSAELGTLPPALRTLLEAMATESGCLDLLYAIDLLVLTGARVSRIRPGLDLLWVERVLTDVDVGVLEGAIIPPGVAAPSDGVSLFFVIAPWRYMVFEGPRGYRRALLDCGALIHLLSSLTARVNGTLAVTTDFYDRELDSVLGLDGIERTVAAVAVFQASTS
jgi:hypothetical protein